MRGKHSGSFREIGNDHVEKQLLYHAPVQPVNSVLQHQTRTVGTGYVAFPQRTSGAAVCPQSTLVKQRPNECLLVWGCESVPLGGGGSGGVDLLIIPTHTVTPHVLKTSPRGRKLHKVDFSKGERSKVSFFKLG